MLEEKIGIIGAGKIGSAVIRGILSNGLVDKNQVMASAPREPTRKALSQETGIKVTSDNGV